MKGNHRATAYFEVFPFFATYPFRGSSLPLPCTPMWSLGRFRSIRFFGGFVLVDFPFSKVRQLSLSSWMGWARGQSYVILCEILGLEQGFGFKGFIPASVIQGNLPLMGG